MNNSLVKTHFLHHFHHLWPPHQPLNAQGLTGGWPSNATLRHDQGQLAATGFHNARGPHVPPVERPQLVSLHVFERNSHGYALAVTWLREKKLNRVDSWIFHCSQRVMLETSERSMVHDDQWFMVFG